MINPRELKTGDVVVFGESVKKTVGDMDWSSPSGKVLVAFGAVDSWHYEDDPLWQIAELDTDTENPIKYTHYTMEKPPFPGIPTGPAITPRLIEILKKHNMPVDHFMVPARRSLMSLIASQDTPYWWCQCGWTWRRSKDHGTLFVDGVRHDEHYAIDVSSL